MMAYELVKVQLQSFLTSELHEFYWSALRAVCFIPAERNAIAHRKNTFSLLVIEPRTFQPIV